MVGECAYDIPLRLSPLDYEAVNAALELRKTMVMPDSEGSEESNETGELLAEICRGWLEMLGRWPVEKVAEAK